MVLVSVRIKEGSSNFETVNFIYANEVKYGTDDTVPAIRHKYAIDTIHHVNEIIDNDIIAGKTFLLLQG